MTTAFEVRPFFLCRLLFSPFVSRCRCRDGWLILDTREGEKAIQMEVITKTRWRRSWLLGSLVVETAEGEAAEVEWVWKRDAIRIANACREALARAAERRRRLERDAQLDALRQRFQRALCARWANYRQALKSWHAVLKSLATSDDDQALSWIHAHATLQLPLGVKPSAADSAGSRQHSSPATTALAIAARPDAWKGRVAGWEEDLKRSHRDLLSSCPLQVRGADTAGEYNETKRLRERMEAFLFSALPCYERAMLAWKAVFGRGVYVAESDFRRWLQPHTSLPPPEEVDPEIAKVMPKGYRIVLQELSRAFREARIRAAAWNQAFVWNEMRNWKGFFDAIEKYPLSRQQREAIVHEEDANLVVAGAGSGKTSTIAGKVGYLLRRGLASPDEILLLAFTRKAAEELEGRVERLFRAPVKVRTFHALGQEIIGAATGRKPALCREAEDAGAKRDLLKELAKELVAADRGFAADFITYQAYHRAPYRAPTCGPGRCGARRRTAEPRSHSCGRSG
jgi:hypothetical protein